MLYTILALFLDYMKHALLLYMLFPLHFQFGSGAKRELKSATATTAEMHGILNLKIVHGGAATLHSIKVLQPKQVNQHSFITGGSLDSLHQY